MAFGLTDGEATERLWSNLGGLSKITKEMTSGNRIDLLVDWLLHYGSKQRERMGIVKNNLFTFYCFDKLSWSS